MKLVHVDTAHIISLAQKRDLGLYNKHEKNDFTSI